jgi:membrane protease YdiL (CAAX protease family)
MGNNPPDPRRLSPAAWLGLVFAMTFPTAAAALYFLVLGGEGQVNRAQQLAYSGGKIVQFLWPLVFVYLADRRWPRLSRPRSEGLAAGLGFGVLVAGAMLVFYSRFLADSALMGGTPAMVQKKLREFHIDSLPAYLALAAFIVAVHSLLEEYYWRWFVFDRLCHGMRPVPAAILSSLAFMAHHVIILYVYFPGAFLTAVVPLSLGIAVGGAVWAWLFRLTEREKTQREGQVPPLCVVVSVGRE